MQTCVPTFPKRFKVINLLKTTKKEPSSYACVKNNLKKKTIRYLICKNAVTMTLLNSVELAM